MKLSILFLAVAAFSSLAAACPGDDSQASALTTDKRFNLVEVTDLGVAGRAQDGNLKPETIYRAIYGDPRTSVPKLIASLTDVRKTRKPVLCPIVSYTTAGDVAFMILGDMFLDYTSHKSTVPGTSEESLIGHSDQAFLIHLHDYIRKHGRASLQQKWDRIWRAYKNKVEWDKKERCFVLTKPVTAPSSLGMPSQVVGSELKTD